MAFSTGTGNNQQDLLDAVRQFALGLGWTIDRWDTTAKRFYLSKGICKVCMEWYTETLATYEYEDDPTSTVIPYGYIEASLVKTIESGDSYKFFEGSGITSNYLKAPLVSNIQGPYTAWFLFSNATGDYIHVVVQISAEVYVHFGFGVVDNNGLTHSGVAYFFCDGGSQFHRTSKYNAVNTARYNDPSYTTSYFTTTGYLKSHPTLALYSEDALPAGFLNQVQSLSAISNASYMTHEQRAFNLRHKGSSYQAKPSLFEGAYSEAVGSSLFNHIITMSAPSWSSYAPMLGIPIIFRNEEKTLACAVGSIHDMRILNMKGMTPQQELTYSTDTWQIFPMVRQDEEEDVWLSEEVTSGQYAFAYKKIL